jgi:hypothetical protein
VAVRRSPEMWLVAYFLSRCGERRSNGRPHSPPPQLGGVSWAQAYSLFFVRLHGGRSLAVFSHSMKNARDEFDGHHDSGRVGWRETDADRPPRVLTPDAARVMAEWEGRADAELWKAIAPLADFRTRGLSTNEVEQLAVSLPARTTPDFLALVNPSTTAPPLVESIDAFEEGGVKYQLHRRKERNRRAVAAKKQRVLSQCGVLACEACDFEFVQVYGSLGSGFAECHHRTPLASLERGNRTSLRDLAIVCANCHRMLHKSTPMLSVEDLRLLVLSQR